MKFWRRDGPLFLMFAALIVANLFLMGFRDRMFGDMDKNLTRTDLMLRLLGEVRTMFAKSLWIRVDLYHHEMERQGIPWTKEREILPLLQTITTLDPHFEEAYDVGAYDLVVNMHRTEEGLAYLQEGLRHNPRSRMLEFEAAFLLFHTHQYAAAIPHAKLAIEFSHESIDAMNAARILAHSAREIGDRPLEIATLQLCNRLMPRDPYTNQRLRELRILPGSGQSFSDPTDKCRWS